MKVGSFGLEPIDTTTTIPTTRFAEMTRNQAYLILSCVVFLIMYGFASLNQAFPKSEKQVTDGGDQAMYRSIIEQIHAGGDYYQVVGNELRTRGYASRPFFNWRLPTTAWGIGHLPNPEWGRWILSVLGFVMLLLWIPVLDREAGFYFASAGSVLMCGMVLLCLSDRGFLMHELWAGTLIALSLAAHARGIWLLSALTGILALFIRELSLPFVCIMFVLAWKERREHEALVWLGGLTVFSLCLTFHAHLVSELITPMDASNKSWVQFGGWPFVLRTGQWNAFLSAVPQWVVVVVLPLALLGVAGWRGGVGSRVALTFGAYCCAFLIAGRMDNYYWGFMYAPLIPLGALFAYPSLRDLLRVAFGRRPLPGC